MSMRLHKSWTNALTAARRAHPRVPAERIVALALQDRAEAEGCFLGLSEDHKHASVRYVRNLRLSRDPAAERTRKALYTFNAADRAVLGACARSRTATPFRVFATSANLNSFGLRGALVVSPCGEVCEIGCSNCPSREALQGRVFVRDRTRWFAPAGLVTAVELPRKLPPSPQLAAENWPRAYRGASAVKID